MKTISELNLRWWYRALKVIHIAFLFLCYAIAVACIVSLFFLIRANKTSYENELKDRAERIEYIQELKNNGDSSTQVIQELNQKFNRFSAYGKLTLTAEEYTAIFGPQENVPVKPVTPNFPASMMWLLLFVPLLISGAWFASELPRRIFYYVVLGNVRPEK